MGRGSCEGREGSDEEGQLRIDGSRYEENILHITSRTSSKEIGMRRASQLGAMGIGSLATAIGALKVAQISANDDWDLVAMKARKIFYGSGKSDLASKKKKKVVVLGSGWGAISFIQQLDLDQVDLTIVSPRSYFFYTPLLAGTATGTVAHTSIMEPIRWYCDNNTATKFIQGECTGVNLKNKTINCSGLNQKVRTLSLFSNDNSFDFPKL